MSIRFARGAVMASIILFSAPLTSTAPPVAAAEPGDLWETTVEMTVAGEHNMALPPRTSKTCRPKGAAWNEPPGGPENSECEMTNVNRTGNTMTWNMRCTDPPVTGQGSIEFQGTDSYRGTMSTSMPQGTMNMKLSGRRVGDCDYGAQLGQNKQIEQQVARAQAQQADVMAKMCTDGARTGQALYFVGPSAVCTEPQHKAAYCSALSTVEGYEGTLAYAATGVDLAQAAAFCGTDTARLLTDVCAKALAANSLKFVSANCPELQGDLCARAIATEQFEVLVGSCPAEAQELAVSQCAGRKYTSMAGSKYAGFCAEYARAEMEQQELAGSNEDPKKKTLDKAKKGLKGLFRR